MRMVLLAAAAGLAFVGAVGAIAVGRPCAEGSQSPRWSVTIDGASFHGPSIERILSGAPCSSPGGEAPSTAEEAIAVAALPRPLPDKSPRSISFSTPGGEMKISLRPGRRRPPSILPAERRAVLPVPEPRKENVHVFLDPDTGEELEISLPGR